MADQFTRATPLDQLNLPALATLQQPIVSSDQLTLPPLVSPDQSIAPSDQLKLPALVPPEQSAIAHIAPYQHLHWTDGDLVLVSSDNVGFRLLSGTLTSVR